MIAGAVLIGSKIDKESDLVSKLIENKANIELKKIDSKNENERRRYRNKKKNKNERRHW